MVIATKSRLWPSPRLDWATIKSLTATTEKIGLRTEGVFIAIGEVCAAERRVHLGTMSVDQIVAQLETKIAHHRERQAFHAKNEAFHREQAGLHGAELESAVGLLQAFRTTSAAAEELILRSRLAAASAEDDAELDVNKGHALSRMIRRVLDGKAPDEAFGPSAVTKEINKRWGAKLRRKVNKRTVAATLRRWAVRGRIHRTREGRARYESLYVKQAPAAAAPLTGNPE